MRQKVEGRWQQLNLRERKIALIGGVIFALFLFYVIIYHPMSESVTQYQQQVKNNTELLSWMQRARSQLKLAAATTSDKTPTTGSVLSIAERSIKENKLTQIATEIKQIQSNQVQIHFDRVSFNQLLPWLQKLPLHYRLSIFKINMKRTDEQGIITATVVVTR